MDHFEADCEGYIPGLDDDEMSKLLDDLSGDCDEDQEEQQSDCENEEGNPMVEVVVSGDVVAGSTNFASFNRSLSTSNQSSSQQSVGFRSVSTLSQSTFGGTPPDDDEHDDSADEHQSKKINTSSACWPHFTKLVAESKFIQSLDPSSLN
jgi:hypothetical protein